LSDFEALKFSKILEKVAPKLPKFLSVLSFLLLIVSPKFQNPISIPSPSFYPSPPSKLIRANPKIKKCIFLLFSLAVVYNNHGNECKQLRNGYRAGAKQWYDINAPLFYKKNLAASMF
jgi:hypothetical protein